MIEQHEERPDLDVTNIHRISLLCRGLCMNGAAILWRKFAIHLYETDL